MSAVIADRYDTILRNGTVVDGTGRPRYVADVAIEGDRVAAIGDLGAASARSTIDARRLVVAPGFIDVHTHDDAQIITHPQMLPKLTQGVTTVIGGNCGIGGAPYSRAATPASVMHVVFKSHRCVAPTFGAYVQKVSDAGPAVNAAFLTGHTTLRMEVMGDDLDRAATESEIAQMRELLSQCLADGSLGLSTGLYYPPARASSTEEVIGIAKPLGSTGGIYATHMRDQADLIIDSLHESLDIGRAVDAPVIISHHKCIGRRNFGRSVETLALLERVGRQQSVAWDVYPYEAASTMLSEEYDAQSSRTLVTWSDPHPEFCARDLDDIVRTWGCTRAEAIRRLQPGGAVYFVMDEADVTRILCTEGAMIGSDGLPEDKHPHPRLWGSFPRVLARYVRERPLLTLEQAVHRMSGLSARRFGLRDRGEVGVGRYADLCVFDPDSIMDRATYEQPTTPATGIQYVFVNGALALDSGVPTSVRAGRVLLRNPAAPAPPTPAAAQTRL